MTSAHLVPAKIRPLMFPLLPLRDVPLRFRGSENAPMDSPESGAPMAQRRSRSVSPARQPYAGGQQPLARNLQRQPTARPA